MKGIKQIKNYRLTKEIGRGATAKVYEAIDERTNKVVAVKTISTEKLKEKRSIENFKRELAVLKKLNHENIIKIEGVEKTSHNIYVVLEYCNGGNLFEYKCYYKKKNKTELNEFFVQKIMRQFIKGLEYMHQNGTIHRDVKLENIMLNFNTHKNIVEPGGLPVPVNYDDVDLNNDFTVKIADLGFARNIEGAGVASTICGTPITMAPDVMGIEGEKTYNNKADLWSLGAITYELLIGNVPFYARNYNDLKAEIARGTYVLPKSIKLSVEAITFINGLLQFSPDKRMGWDKIKSHPFIVNKVENFHFIDLQSVGDVNEKNLEINTKNCDNFLWLNFKNQSLNMGLDKVNEEVIQNPEVKKIIEENATKNEEILKAIEEEKKKIDEERKKLEEERKEAEKFRKEAENLKIEAQKMKEMTEKQKNQLKIEGEKNMQLELERQKKELEKKKQFEEKEKEILSKVESEKQKLEEERKKNLKLKEEAEKMYLNAQQIKENAEKQAMELKKQKEIEESQRVIEEQKRKEEAQKRLDELIRREQLQKEKEEQLKKELEKLKLEADNLKKEVQEKKNLQTELEQKQKEKEELIQKINQIANEKDRKIMEIEKENKEKELKLLEERQKREQEELIKKELLIQNDILKKEKEIQNVKEKGLDFDGLQDSLDNSEIDDDWEDLNAPTIDFEVTESGNTYEILNSYF